jgi:enamine deaminase RidA (YjgF/YER057c/UK114 family)
MKRERYSSGTPWEPIVGYSRAIRVGSMIYTSGTTATDAEGNLVGVGDPYAQTVQTIKNIERALQALGATLQDVIRTRIYVLDIEAHWQEIGRAHGEFFRDVRPVTSMIEIRKLIDPRMLVEIEAEASTPMDPTK